MNFVDTVVFGFLPAFTVLVTVVFPVFTRVVTLVPLFVFRIVVLPIGISNSSLNIEYAQQH